MGLYLCVFRDDEELEGVDVGAYADFEAFRDYVPQTLEGGKRGHRFPVLMLHPDSDGEWSVAECRKLEGELGEIAQELRARPPVPFSAAWQPESAREAGLVLRSAHESSIDVDGEPLVDRLIALARTATRFGVPIPFQWRACCGRPVS